MIDLPFQDSADTAATRKIILDEIDRMQSVVVACAWQGADNRFDWRGSAHWFDQERWLALEANNVPGFCGATTLPHLSTTEDLLSFYGGEDRALDVIDVVDVFSWLVADTLDKHSWLPFATQTLNLVVVQPLVNPACAPLFWVAMNAALDPNAPELMDIMRPMTFDMSTYPTSRSAAASVRAAQAAFFQTWGPDQLPADWATLDDHDWATACTQLVWAARHGIESHVFELIAQRASAIRAGRRPG